MMKSATFSNTWTEFHDARHCCVLSESFLRGFIAWPSSDDRNKAKILGHLLTRYNCRGWEWNFFWRWNHSSLPFFLFLCWSVVSSVSCDERPIASYSVVYERNFFVRIEPHLFCPREISCGFGFFSPISFFYLFGWLSVASLVMIKQILSFCLMLLKKAMRKKVWRPELKRASAAFALVRFRTCLLLFFFLRCDDATIMYMLDYGDVPWWSSVNNITRIWAEL